MFSALVIGVLRLRTRKPEEGIETRNGESDIINLGGLRTRKPEEGIETARMSEIESEIQESQN